MQNTDTPHAGEDVEQQEISITGVGNAEWSSRFEDSWAVSHKTKHTLSIPSSNRAPWDSPMS